MNDNGVVWQMTQMGKNEQGGGGTVALDLANRNIDTIDAGVPVLAMHAPIDFYPQDATEENAGKEAGVSGSALALGVLAVCLLWRATSLF